MCNASVLPRGLLSPKIPGAPASPTLSRRPLLPALLPCAWKTDETYHQVVTKPQTEFVRFASGELPALLVLCEAMFGRVSRLADTERSECGRSPNAAAIQFDDVDRIGARDSFRSAGGSSRHSAGFYRPVERTARIARRRRQRDRRTGTKVAAAPMAAIFQASGSNSIAFAALHRRTLTHQALPRPATPPVDRSQDCADISRDLR